MEGLYEKRAERYNGAELGGSVLFLFYVHFMYLQTYPRRSLSLGQIDLFNNVHV